MKEFSDYELTGYQFTQLIGRARFYQHLPKVDKLKIPQLDFNDFQINTIANNYYKDNLFGRKEDGLLIFEVCIISLLKPINPLI